MTNTLMVFVNLRTRDGTTTVFYHNVKAHITDQLTYNLDSLQYYQSKGDRGFYSNLHYLHGILC